MHPRWVLDGQRALFLQHDVIVFAFGDCLGRLALVPVRAQRSPADTDEPPFQVSARRLGHVGQHIGQVVALGETVADEENVELLLARALGGRAKKWAAGCPIPSAWK